MIGIIFMFLIVVTFFSGALVAACRINCNRCGSDTKAIKNLGAAKKSAILFFIFCIIAFLGVTGFVSYYSVLAFLGIRDSTFVLVDETANTDNTVKNVIDTTGKLNAGTLKDYTQNLPDITDFQYLLTETSIIKSVSNSFSDKTYAYEVARFSWTWIQLFASILAVILTFAGYKNFHAELFLTLLIYLLYALIVTHLALLAFIASELFVTLDICEQVYGIVQFNNVPTTEYGIAYYARPFSYESVGITLAQIYMSSVAYDDVMQRIVNTFKTKCPSQTPPSTREVFESMFLSSNTSSCVDGMGGERDALKQLDKIIEGLLDLRYARHIRKLSQDSEWPLCVRSVNSLAYVFYGCIAWTLLISMFTITAIRFRTIKEKIEESGISEL